MTARVELTFWEVEFPPCWSLSARSCLLPNILDKVPTTPFTDSYPYVRGQHQVSHQAEGRTYALGKAPPDVSLDVIQNLFDLSLDLLLGPQHLAGFDIQEAKGVDCIQSVEELRLREGNFVVILRLLERNAGLGKVREFHVRHGSRAMKPSLPLTRLATH